MKLLLDQNLSFRLKQTIGHLFEQIAHVQDFGLQQADDDVIWKFAAQNAFAIVSKDADFHQRSFVRGFPPKTIWLRVGNCTTAQIGRIILAHAEMLATFQDDPEASFLIIED